MQVAEKLNKGLKRAYKITVSAEEIEKQVDTRLEEVAKTARMPGFRPGKIPVKLLKQTHRSAVMGEILEKTVTDTSQSALQEKELRPVAQPKIEIDKFDDGSDLEYTMELEVFPKIDIMDFKSIKLEKLKVSPTSDDVEAAVGRIAEGQKTTKPVKGRDIIQKGDIAVINFVGRINGEEFSGGKAEDYPLEIGSGAFIPGFEEQIIGKKVGQKCSVNVDFPENYAEELAGKPATFEVEIKELQESVPATIDDELAKKLGLKNIEELKTQIKESHEKEFETICRMRVKRQLLDLLDKAHNFDLPEDMSEQEFNNIWQEYDNRRKENPDQVDEGDKDKTDDQLKLEFKEIAERRIKIGLIFAEISKVEDLKVTSEELNKRLQQEIQQEIQRQPGKESEIRDTYTRNPQFAAALESGLLEDKVVDFILEGANLKERIVSPDQFMSEEESEKVESTNQSKTVKKKASKKKKGAAKKKAKTK